MRKLISILSVLLLMIGGNTASAQFAFKKLTAIGDPIMEASQLEDGGYYVLQNFYKGKYLKIKTDGTMVLGYEEAITPENASDGLAVFKLHKIQSGSTTLYQFESARTGYYIPKILNNHHTNGEEIKGAVISKNPGLFELKTEATVDPNQKDDTPDTKPGYFTIKNSTDNCYLDLYQGSNLLTGWLGRGDRAWFRFIKVTLDGNPSTLQVLYKTVVKKDGVAFYTAYGLATTGETYHYTAPTKLSDNLVLSSHPTDFNITAKNNTFEYNYTNNDVNLFTPGQWYSLKIKDGDRLLRAVAEEEGLYVNAESGSDLSAASNTYPNFLNALWRFEESGLGVKIYNKGTGKYLKTNGSGEDKANRVSFDDAGTVFIVKQKEGGITLYTAAGDGYLAACCSNAASNSSNTRLGVQLVEGTSESPASCVMLSGAEEDLLPVGKNAFADMSDALYVYTEDNVLKKGGHYSAYQSSAAAATTLATLLECGDKVGSEANPEETAYYLIRNVSQGAVGTNDDMNKYLSSEYVFCNTEGDLQEQVGTVKNDRNVKRTKGRAALLPRLWKFERTSEGKYYLLNVNAGHYAAFVKVANNGKFEFSLEKPQETNGVFYIHATDTKFNSDKKVINDNTTMFLMGINDVYVNVQSDMPGAQNDKGYSEVAGWESQTDAGNYWQFIKVTEVPLTIDANDYTTLCLPFNVKLPENSTVKAYYASQATGNVLKLTEITGIIPANEGVILQNTNKSEAANINLTITPEETTTLTGNQLRGVTAKREGYTAKQNYVLAKGNKGIGFYKANFTAIPANKAYLPSENIMNAQGVMMAFSFGDEVTGIDNVNAAAPAAKKYYDLQGRRVLYPAKGIFVTEDGQKVLFK